MPPCLHALISARYSPAMERWASRCSLCGTFLAYGVDQTDALDNGRSAAAGQILDRMEIPDE